MMTFNLNGNDYELEPEHAWRSWATRAALTLRVMRRYAPDLVGLQEVTMDNLAFYSEHLSNYSHKPASNTMKAITRSTARSFGNASALIGWSPENSGLATRRTCAPPTGACPTRWARPGCAFTTNRLTDYLLHLNTHFEDGPDGEQSRVAGSRLIIGRIQQLAPGIPVILTGDFNCNPWSTPYNLFLEAGFVDSYRAAGHADSVASSTFHGHEGERYFALDYSGGKGTLFWRVDWILARAGSQPMQCGSSMIVREGEPPLFPSDHYPVVSEIMWPQNS